jgi:hypothetical protein
MIGGIMTQYHRFFSVFLRRSAYAVVSLSALALLGCGSGGGSDGGFVGAARINLSVSPDVIDTNDRARVSIDIEDVIDTGIVLKVRYSTKLAYAVNTAKLKVRSEDSSTVITPTIMDQTSNWKYLVFFLPRSLFGDLNDDSSSDQIQSEPATLTLELIGKGRLADGIIEGDADVNDPTIPDGEEFNIQSPGFEAETEASIQVRQSR